MLWGVIYQECRRHGKGSLAGASVRGDTMNLPELFVTGLDERGHFTFQRWSPPPGR
jgi:hypothetical protein